MRLLPKDPHIGWTPYAWLIYLSGFLADPFVRHQGLGRIAATFAVAAIFVVLYFAGFWQLAARAGWKLKAIAAAIALLGVVCAPFNGGSLAFYIYAASFCGFIAPRRTAMAAILTIVAAIGAVQWGFHLPFWYGFIAAAFSLLIGSINLHQSAVREGEAKLMASQEEVSRLAKTAERERIARDLHDLLGHSLSLITLKAELAGKLLDRDPQRAAAEVAELERISRQALREVRAALAGYRSDGLDAELARARLALESSGIECEYFLTPIVLEPARETALALALREAVTNVVRHARARRCYISLDQTPAEVILEVRDDGEGCRGGEETDGMGLTSMRARIEGLGGTYLRTGVEGTLLRLALPKRPRRDEGSPAPVDGRLAGASPLG